MRRSLIIVLMTASLSFARSLNQSGNRFWDIKPIKINDLWFWNSNYGEFGQNENGPGGEWPGGSGQMYNFGSGLWIGCISADGETLVTVGYNPNTGSGEMVPGLIEMGSNGQTDPDVRIYQFPGDWPPPYEKFPMAPQEYVSLADQWMCFNDGDPEYHAPADTRPIGLEVYQSVYGWDYGLNRDVIFFRWVIKNLSGDSLHGVYLGICDDPDIGYADDDVVRCFIDTSIYDPEPDSFIHIDNIGFDHDYSGSTQGWDSVGCIAFDYLQRPYALHDGIDNDGDGIKDGEELDSILLKQLYPPRGDRDKDGVGDWKDPSEIEQLDMTSFIRFTLDIDPSWDFERYKVLKGLDYRTNDSVGYMRDDNKPGDKRFVISSGSFSMADGDTVVAVIAVICAGFHHPGGSGTDSLHLVRRDAFAQFVFDMNWLLPGPPPSPTVRAIPGDHVVTLVWDDTPEHTPDPFYEIAGNPNSQAYDSFFVQYDFQGYKVYKSLTGVSNDWVLLTQCDIVDTVDTSVLYDTIQPESIRTAPLNSGLFHSYVDSSPRNGFTYYYAVTSYDFNAMTVGDSLKRQFSLESGKKVLVTSPRREPANYIPPTCSVVTVNVPEYAATEFDMKIVVPTDVTNSHDVLKFFQPTCDTSAGLPTRPIYWYELKHNDSTVIAKTGFPLLLGDSISVGLPVVDGIESRFRVRTDELKNEEVFSYFEVISGNYPQDSLTPTKTVTIHRNLWAFTGADYRVRWHSTSNGMEAVVTDLNTDEEIPYKPFNPLHDTLKQNAYSWCFLNKMTQAATWSRYLIPDESAYLHITGGYFAFLPSKTGLPSNLFPKDGDEWVIHSKRLRIVPYGCEYHLYSNKIGFLRDTTIALNVKVVPNPYIVENEWQSEKWQKKLRFINLPDRCTIRIYTVAGDLLKVIRHNNSYQQSNDAGGDEWWDVLTDLDLVPASGVYLFHIDSDVGEQVGKFAVIIGQ